MDNNLQQLLIERTKQLPEVVRDFILSADFGARIRIIAQAHNLHIDQAEQLETETLIVMLGVDKRENYVLNLQSGLRISEEQALAIARDVNEKIFSQARDFLKQVSESARETQREDSNTAEEKTQSQPNPQTVKQQSFDITRVKLEDTPPNTSEKTSFPSDSNQQKTRPQEDVEGAVKPSPQQTAYTGTDPYREPIE